MPDTAELLRRIAKLERINAALIQRIDRLDAARSSVYSLSRATEVLEREVIARNLDLERTLAELSAANAELTQAQQVADEANRAKSRFLRAASHDLLQPLSAAKLFVSHLGDIARDPHQRQMIESIEANFDSAEELIHDLLDIARLDSRTLVVKPAPVSIGRLFRRLASDMQALSVARGIGLTFVPSSLTVLSDPIYLRRIAQNLVSNALKYTSTGRVLVGARRRHRMAWLEVHDTGPGIAEADRERIFHEFERVPGLEQPGTGLGLSIVERACRQLGHQIELHSRVGVGSCFRVGLPVVEGLCLIPEPKRSRSEGDTAPLAGHAALVLEDDPAMRRAFTLVLESWGMEVVAAAGTPEALALLAAGAARPDVLLTDFDLGAGDTGDAAISALRAALGAPVPAVIVTGEHSAAVTAGVTEGLGVGVLRKPVAEVELRGAIAALLRGRG